MSSFSGLINNSNRASSTITSAFRVLMSLAYSKVYQSSLWMFKGRLNRKLSVSLLETPLILLLTSITTRWWPNSSAMFFKESTLKPRTKVSAFSNSLYADLTVFLSLFFLIWISILHLPRNEMKRHGLKPFWYVLCNR